MSFFPFLQTPRQSRAPCAIRPRPRSGSTALPENPFHALSDFSICWWPRRSSSPHTSLSRRGRKMRRCNNNKRKERGKRWENKSKNYSALSKCSRLHLFLFRFVAALRQCFHRLQKSSQDHHQKIKEKSKKGKIISEDRIKEGRTIYLVYAAWCKIDQA